MGSGSSKDAAAASSSSSSSSSRGLRSRGARVFNASCFGLPSTLPDNQNDEADESIKGNAATGEEESKSTVGNHSRSRKIRFPRNNKVPSLVPEDVDHSGGDREYISQIERGASSSSNATAAISRTLNPSGRSRSRFSFIPDRIGFRLSRTASLGSSRACSLFSDATSIPNTEGGDNIVLGFSSSADSRNESQDHTSVEVNASRYGVGNNMGVESSIIHYSHRNRLEENAELRRSSRRSGPQEPLEGSVRFSRTLSVGRLRDRVLRRTSSSTGTLGPALLEDGSVGYTGRSNERRALGGRRRVPSSSDRNIEAWPDSSTNLSYHYGHESETPQPRETAHDLLDNRSAFLERRRRIRSQVRALQRLGSRFENLSGHERSCILSGQHRTGRCTCRASNRAANPNDDTSTRASISRIVMLAEALFEVLDEIHQQSVALSSRPSFSSIGSVPAPKEVVDCMPVKVYMKPDKHQNEETAQCYICLVEYEDGDTMRILPCSHEFHRTCIDKWLKEIHRVCPLCRGDVCRSDGSGAEKIS